MLTGLTLTSASPPANARFLSDPHLCSVPLVLSVPLPVIGFEFHDANNLISKSFVLFIMFFSLADSCMSGPYPYVFKTQAKMHPP